jgi:hypothetical protein
MNAYELVDVAALAAVHGEQLVSADAATINESLTTYWKSSRCRLNRWSRSLASLARQSEWTANELQAVEEILVSDILTRVVAAIAVAHDQRHSPSESAPVARNIAAAHLDVKRRAMALVLAPHRSADHANELLTLRRQSERWTDMLLSYLTPLVATDEFAVDAARVGDFAFDAREHLQSRAASDMAMTMIVAGLRSSFVPISKGSSLNADLNSEIATAIVACFAPDFFDSHGYLRSTWLERLRRVPNESPVNIDNWWHASPGESPNVRPAHWRR